MEFITTGNRIAVENFDIGKIYTITFETGNYKSLACTGKGTDFVMFQDQEPDLLFCLTMDSAISVSSIEEGGGGSGTMNYNELENKPSINGFVLIGNKTGADLGLASQSDLEDYATNASVVAGLATKQDALSSSQLQAVNSGITSALVTQIGTNTSAIAGKQDALSSSQLAAVNSGITSALVTQIGTNTSTIAGKQDALSSSQLAAVNSGITSADVAQITTNKNNILSLVVNGGGKNKLQNTAVSSGNFTVNADKTVTANGTFATAAEYTIGSLTGTINGIFSGCTGGSNSTYRLWIQYRINEGAIQRIDLTDGEISINLSNVTWSAVQIRVEAGQTLNNVIFKPMISDVGGEYQPYCPSNFELYQMILNL